jgi:hypothetical protein
VLGHGTSHRRHPRVSRKSCRVPFGEPGPVAITRHGNTIGYYIPARRKRTEGERAALEEAATRLAEVLAARGVTEDELVVDFKKWRAAKRK